MKHGYQITTFMFQKFQTKHPSVFQPHSTVNIPNKLSENAKSLLLNVSL